MKKLYVLCVSGACCPEDILRVPEEGGGVLIPEDQDWGPSCCGQNLETDRDSGPSYLLEMVLGPGRDRDEVSLPSGGQEWTSLRGMRVEVCGSSKYHWKENDSILGLCN